MNVVTNPNSTSITFYCPNYLKNSFDELIRFKRISRTSIINSLMEGWLRTEYKKLKEDDEMNKLIMDVKVRNHKNNPPKLKPQKTKNRLKWESRDEYDPPMIPSTDDEWNIRL